MEGTDGAEYIFGTKRRIVRLDTDGTKRRAGECHIHEMPRYCDDTRIGVDNMQSVRPIKWCGDGLGALTLSTIDALMKPQREKGGRVRKAPSLTHPAALVQ